MLPRRARVGWTLLSFSWRLCSFASLREIPCFRLGARPATQRAGAENNLGTYRLTLIPMKKEQVDLTQLCHRGKRAVYSCHSVSCSAALDEPGNRRHRENKAFRNSM